MDDLRDLARDNGAAGVLDAIADRSGMLHALRASEDPQDASRIENIMELVAVGREFNEENPEGSLADFLEKVALVADADQLPDAENGGGVVTLHDAAHGEGTRVPSGVPHGARGRHLSARRAYSNPGPRRTWRRSAGSRTWALTRARQRLYLTRAELRASFGAPQYYAPSRFVEEIPTDLVEWSRSQTSMATLRARSDRASSRSGAWSSMGYGSAGNQDRDDGNTYGRAGAVSTRSVPPSPPGGGASGDLGLGSWRPRERTTSSVSGR